MHAASGSKLLMAVLLQFKARSVLLHMASGPRSLMLEDETSTLLSMGSLVSSRESRTRGVCPASRDLTGSPCRAMDEAVESTTALILRQARRMAFLLSTLATTIASSSRGRSSRGNGRDIRFSLMSLMGLIRQLPSLQPNVQSPPLHPHPIEPIPQPTVVVAADCSMASSSGADESDLDEEEDLPGHL